MRFITLFLVSSLWVFSALAENSVHQDSLKPPHQPDASAKETEQSLCEIETNVKMAQNQTKKLHSASSPLIAMLHKVEDAIEDLLTHHERPCGKKQTDIEDKTCLEVIKILSAHDACLCSLKSQKKDLAKLAFNAYDFVDLIREEKCNGTEYNCGETRSWVTEIFEGLRTQYEESKYDDESKESAKKTGNKHCLGHDLMTLFESNKDSQQRIIYHMRHTGTHDHVWVIEQLPHAKGYRVYGSYHDAYSLHAWLSEDLTNLFDADHGHLMIWRTVQNQTDAQIRQLTNGAATLYNLEALGNHPLLPYVSFVANYDEAQVMENFKNAWSVFGKGHILSQNEFFKNYLTRLVSLVAYFDSHGNDNDEPYPNEIYSTWIDLFGSPDPMYFPGLPNNILSSLLTAGKSYRFEVKAVELSDAPHCLANAISLHSMVPSDENELQNE